MPTLTEQLPETRPSGDRIRVIDALRGFALLGIIIAHVSNHYLAGMLPPSAGTLNLFTPLDKTVGDLGNLLTFGKFFTIFSFLFGLSFAIQFDNTAQKKQPFAGRFVWRLVILFAIGFVHNLFYSGDILSIYAVLGLFLILLHRLGNRALLIVSLLLIFNAPLLIGRMISLGAPPPAPAQIEAQRKQGEAFMKTATEQYETKRSGTVGEVVAMNAATGMTSKLFFQLFSGRLFITLGLFLLGLYAGRKQFFTDSPENRRFFRRLLMWSGIVALVSTALVIAFNGSSFGGQGWRGVIGATAFDVHQATLSAFYVAGVTLLYWRYQPRLLESLVAVGRMGLTTYLMQSVFGVLLFLGFGLGQMGKIGIAASVAIGIAFFALQIPFANWWLSRFQYGPVEWLWRSLTYLKIQPMRKVTRVPMPVQAELG